MGTHVLSFFRRRTAVSNDWSAQETAEFYRVEAALIQAGMQVIADRGLTDEGDPWFVFCRAEDDEVIIHFARINGRYLVSAPSYCGIKVDTDFHALVRSVVMHYPVVQQRRSSDNVLLHPSALLVMLVASALLKSGYAAAMPASPIPANATKQTQHESASRTAEASLALEAAAPEAQHETLIIAAMNAALVMSVQATMPTFAESGVTPISESSVLPHMEPVATPASITDAQSALPQGAGSVTPVAAFQPSLPVAVSQHTVTLTGVHAFGISSTEPVAADSLPLPTPPLVGDWGHFSPSGDAVINTMELPASIVPDLTKPELHLLQMLGVVDQVSYTNTVPAVLSAVSHSGDKIEGVSAPTTQAVSAHQTIAASAPAASAAPASSPTSGSSTASDIATSAAPPSSHSNELVVSVSLSGVPAMLATVDEFRAIVHPVGIVTDNSIIFYDANAVRTMLNDVKSITYELHDGLSISLVGLPAELVQAGVHMQ